MAKGEFDMLYLCAGGSEKKTLRLSGGASQKRKEKIRKSS